MKTLCKTLFPAVLAGFIAFAPTPSLHAAILTWDANGATAGQTDGTGTWLNANQWWNGAANVTWNNGTPDSAVFGNGGTGGTITISSVTAGSVTFGSFGGTYTLGSSTLTLNGDANYNPSAYVSSQPNTNLGTVGLYLGNTSGAVSITSGIVLGGSQQWINNSASLLTVSSNFSLGANVLTIDGTGNTTVSGLISGFGGSIVKNGAGTLNFGNAGNTSTFTGGVTVNNGTFKIANVANFTMPTYGTVTVNGGTFDINNSNMAIGGLNGTGGVVTNSSASSKNLLLDGTGAYSSASALTGGANLTLSIALSGSGSQILSGTNTYTGNTTITSGKVTMSGSLTSAVFLNGGSLLLDMSTNTANILNSGAVLTLGGGALTVKGASSGLSSQTVNGLTLSGGGASATVDANGGGGTLLAFGAISRSVGTGATINFNLPSGAQTATNGITTSTGTNAAGIIGGYATVGGADWASKSGSNIVALATYTDIAALGSSITSSTTSNVRINSAGSGGNIVLNAGTTDISTLLQNTATAATVDTANKTLRLGLTGGILLAPGSQGLTIGVAANDGRLTAGGAANTASDLILSNYSSSMLTVNAVISDNGSPGVVTLVKSGSGALTLGGNNTYTGQTYLNGGTTSISSNANLGDQLVGSQVNINGGILQATGNVSLSNGVTGANNRAVVLNGNGGTFDVTAGNTLTIAGNISGGGVLVKNNTGSLTLGGFNTNSGGVVLNSGTLNISGLGGANGTLNTNFSQALGAGLFTINGGAFDNTSGSAIQMASASGAIGNAQYWNGSFTFIGSNNLNMGTGAVTLNVTPTITVNAGILTIGGIISGTNGITKAGAGTLTLTGVNTYSGTTTISGGVLRTSVASATALGTGVVNLAGGELQLAIAGNNGSPQTFVNNVIVTASSKITADSTILGDSRPAQLTLGTLSIGASTLTVAAGPNALSPDSTGNPNQIIFGATTLTGNATFNIINAPTASFFTPLALVGIGKLQSTRLTLGAINNGANTATLTGNGSFTQTGVWGGGSGGITLDTTYSGTATLSQVNTFTGAVTINGGVLVANTLANGGLASNLGASTNAASNLVLGGGTLQTSYNGTIDRNFTLTNSSTSTISNSSTLTITGSAASSTGSLIKAGSSVLTLTGANAYSGSTTVAAGTLKLDFNAAGAPASDIIGNGANGALILTGGTLSLAGKNSNSSSQTFTSLTVGAGGSAITAANGTSGTMNTVLNGITRVSGSYGTVDFTKPTNGNITTTSSNDATGILGPWATVNSGADYATVSGGNIVALGAANTSETSWTSSSGNFAFNTAQTLTAARSVNTLRDTNASNTVLSTFDLTTNGLLNGNGGTWAISSSGGRVVVGASGELVLAGNGSFTTNISAPVAIGANGVVTKGGSTGTVNLTGGISTAGAATLVNDGGTFTVSGTNNISLGGDLTIAGPGAMTLSSGWDLNGASRTVFVNDTSTTATTISGTLNDTGGTLQGENLKIGGSGYVNITGLLTNTPANLFPGIEINGTGIYSFGANGSFIGNITLTAGTLVINGVNNPFGASGSFIAKGGTITAPQGNPTNISEAAIFDGVNNTPITFATSPEGFDRDLTFSGGLTIQNSPTLNFTNAAGNGSGARNFSTVTTTLLSGFTVTGTHTASVNFTGGLTFSGNRTITFNDTGNDVISGALAGGANTLTLAGTNNPITQGNTLTGVQFGAGSAVSGVSGGIIVDGPLVTFNNSGNSFSGGVTLKSGVIMLSTSSTGNPVTTGPVGTGTLTLQGGSIGWNSGGGGPSIGNALVLDGVNGTTISFINGNDGFNRAATFSGTTTIQNNPILNFATFFGDSGSPTGAGNNGSRTFSGATTLNSGFTVTGTHIAQALFTGGLIFTGNRTITLNDAGPTIFRGAMNGGLNTLTLSGSSTTDTFGDSTGAVTGTTESVTIDGPTVNFAGANTWTGITTFKSGVGIAGKAEIAGTSGPFGKSAAANAGSIVFSGGTLRYSSVNQNDYSGRIGNSTGAISIDTAVQNVTFATALASTNTGGLTKLGQGTLTLSASNQYTGTTTVVAGTLAEGVSNAILSGGVTVNGVGATFDLGANHVDTVGTVTVDGGGIIAGTGTSALTSTASFEMKNGSVNTTLAGSGIALNKTTAGTATLSGSNSYTGATTISAGALALASSTLTNNIANSTQIIVGDTLAHASATLDVTGITGGFVVPVAQALSGFGTVNSSTAVTVNGTLTPGTGTGTGVLKFSNGLTIGNGVNLNYGLGTTGDLVAVTGGLTLSGSAVLNFVPAGTLATNTAYNLFTYTGTLTGGANLSTWSIGTGTVPGGTTGETFATVALGGGTSAITVTFIGGATPPAVAYWQGTVGSSGTGSWATVTGGATNFTSDAAGTSNTGAIPTSITNVKFTANSGSNVTTTLGQDFTINSLEFTGTSTTAGTTPVTIGGTNTLTILSGTNGGNTAGNGIMVDAGSAAHTISSKVALGANQTWTVNGNPLTVSGNVSDGGNSYSLTKSGTGTLIMSGSAGYTGATTVNSGALQVDGSLSGSSAVTVNVATLSGTGTVNGTVGLTGSSTLASTGNLTLAQGFNVAGGNNLISTGTITGNAAQSANSGLTVNGRLNGTDTLGVGASLAGTGTVGATTLSGSNTLSSTGVLTVASLGVSGSGNQISSGTVNATAGTTLGANSRLAVNGTLGGGAVTTGSGAVLSGTGKITSALTVSAGGKTYPGNGTSAAVLTTDLTYNNGSTAEFGIFSGTTPHGGNAGAGTVYDQMIVTGAVSPQMQIGGGTTASQLSLGTNGSAASGVTLTLSMTGSVFTAMQAGATNSYQGLSSNNTLNNYFVFQLGAGVAEGRFQTLDLNINGTDYVGTIQYGGTGYGRFGSSPGVTNTLGDVVVNGQEFALSYSGNYLTNSTTGGNDIVLTAIPEPGTWGMILGGFGMLIGFQKLRKRRVGI